jgi:DNA polymerase (family 10)
LAKGPTKAIVVLKNNIQADLRVVPEESYGSALQYFTGDKQHNIALRIIAKDKGLKLSEYGITDLKTNKKYITKKEEDVYRILGFKLIPPEERHNRGELERYKLK